MKNLMSFEQFSLNEGKTKTSSPMSDFKRKEKEEKERWKKIEKEMLDDEKKMKANAQSDMKKFFSDDRKAGLPNSNDKNKIKNAVIDTSEIEERERKKWKKLENDMLEDERDMKRDAEKDMKTFFKKIKSTPSTQSSSSNYDSRQMGKREISDLHYSSQYKSRKPKTTSELKRLIETGAIEQVYNGVYHFSLKENGVKKYFFRFI